MRLVIDMQGAQSASRLRGIGRYSLSISKEIARLRGDNEVILALNGLLPDAIESIRAAFEGILPMHCIRVWYAVGPVCSNERANDTRRYDAELIREAFLASLKPDVVLITSLFEGLGDDAVTSIANFTNKLPTAAILYDLIPHIHRDIYLQNKTVSSWYANKMDHLRRADLLLSISAASGNEAFENIGFPNASIVNVSTACENEFRPIKLSANAKARLRSLHGLTRPFVMYTTAGDVRKNNETLIRAYAKLPKVLRDGHQLVLVSSTIVGEIHSSLTALGNMLGLDSSELIILFNVKDQELIELYNGCKLFVFASFHEGFGLPALEAMACGRAVIGANTSSLIEVINRADALFDPFDCEAIARKIEEVLTNESFRIELESHGLEQAKKFSWHLTASIAWSALAEFASKRSRQSVAVDLEGIINLSYMFRRPKLAYFAPVFEDNNGIAEYSIQLLPFLSRHYDIEVVVEHAEMSDTSVFMQHKVHEINWFRENSNQFDRVLYHVGNLASCSSMVKLAQEYPGVVVLHDFFLFETVEQAYPAKESTDAILQTLVANHGWSALCNANVDVISTRDMQVYPFPCNFELMQRALGIIVHSSDLQNLAIDWYGPHAGAKCAVVPLMRPKFSAVNRNVARKKLGLRESDFLVCSLGDVERSAFSHQLLSAWFSSALSKDPRCKLVFVGQTFDDEYGIEMLRQLRANSPSQVEIAGSLNIETRKLWIAASDVGVHLRSENDSVSLATRIDFMSHGLATIVGGDHTTVELPDQLVLALRQDFADEDIALALTALWTDENRRIAIGDRAREFAFARHEPRFCAEKYSIAIEQFYKQASTGLPALFAALPARKTSTATEYWPELASALANSFPPQPRRKQMFIDVSELVQADAKTGVQRVVRALLQELLINPPDGWSVEPIYATTEAAGYRYARKFTCQFLGYSDSWCLDEPIGAWMGDVFLGLDLQHHVVQLQQDYLLALRRRGVSVFMVVYDLLPVLLPHAFPDGAQAMHHKWLQTLSQFDGAICISQAVSDELYDWLQTFGPKRERSFSVSWFHLGADFGNSMPTKGMPSDSPGLLKALNSRPSFLMVGTIEPRKGQGQALAAFEQIWNAGVDTNLVIVGKRGWKVESLVQKLRKHNEYGKRLFWLEGISDEYLDEIYKACTCLLAASEGEGFGLPLIEGAQHNIPIIARDIPVFREVVGDSGVYFEDSKSPHVMAEAVTNWLVLLRTGSFPHSSTIRLLSWKESANQLLAALLDGCNNRKWLHDDAMRFWGGGSQVQTRVGERHGKEMRTTGLEGYLIMGPFLAMRAGRYSLQLAGTYSASSEFDILRVVYGEGHHEIAALALRGFSGKHWRARLEIDLPTDVADLEIKVWVGDEARLAVSEIELVQIADVRDNDGLA